MNNINPNDEGLNNDSFARNEQGGQESLFEIILKRQLVVVIAVVVCVLGALGYLLKATPIYSSSSRIYVEQSGPRIMNETEGVMTQSKNYLYTQSSLMISTPIMSEVVDNPEIANLRTFTDVDNKIGFLKNKISAEVGKKDDIIEVSMESPYAVEAAQIVNAVVDSYITYHSTKKKSTSAEVLKILQGEKVKRDKELADKYQEVLDFKTKNADLAMEDSSGNILLQSLTRVMNELTNAKIDTINARANYEALKKMASDPKMVKQLIDSQRNTINITMDQEETRLKSQIDSLYIRRTELTQKVNENHPSVKSVDDKIKQLEAKLQEIEDKATQAYIEVAYQTWQAAQQREVEFQTEVDLQRAKAEQLNTKTAELAIMTSELNRTENLCDILDSRIKELNVTEDAGALNISILEVAQPSEKSVKPQRSRIMAMALVLGLMLGCGLALLLDFLDHRLRNLEDIQAVVGAPVLGTVSHMAKEADLQARGQLVHKQPLSQIAESYKTVRTAIFFGATDGKNKTILVTSPEPGDGKSTTISNLAIAMAQAGQKVLLMDCDFRKPVQHSIFSTEQEPGLSAVISGQLAFDKIVHKTAQENLDMVSCGKIPVNPSELLNSKSFTDLLEKLTGQYDRILLDAPPLTMITDSRILAAKTDMTVLVVRAEKTSRRTTMHARAGLESVGARLLGVVVNDISHKKGVYGYYSGYGYGYGYKKYGGYYGKDKANS